MPDGRSKAGIVERLEYERALLQRTMAPLSPDELLETGVVGERSVKDVLAHLAHWEAEMPRWLEASRRGEAVGGPEAGMSWRQLKLFNEHVYEAHREDSLAQVLAYFQQAHAAFMDMVAAMPEDELLARDRYPLTAGDALYDWLVAYAQHDAWGTRRIREWIEAGGRSP